MVKYSKEVIFVPRAPRTKSKSGTYHVIMRGINRQSIFEDIEDREKFIQTLQRYKDICQFKLYAYCLMDNHIHLLLKVDKEPLETVFRRICGSYVLFYNNKYDRSGNLFQDRFKSEPVEDDKYFLTAFRYILRNPVKAGIVTKIENYRWTNYVDYFEQSNMTDSDFVIDIFNKDKNKGLEILLGYVNTENDDKCMEIGDRQSIRDDDARKIIKDHCKVEQGIELQKLDIDERDTYLRDLKKEYGLSIRQIARLTGISRGIVERV